MKKIFLGTILLTLSIYASEAILFDSAEEARIQNYIGIDKKIKEVDLKLNSSDYVYDFNTYIRKNDINLKKNPHMIDELNELNKSFIFSEKPFKYNKFLISLSYELPKKERMVIVKEIILEEADYLIFKNLVDEKLKNECIAVRNLKKEEYKKLVDEKKNVNQYISKVNECRLDGLTVNGKAQFLKDVEKKAFKYLFLEKLYLTKNKSMDALKKQLKFFKSKEYQDTYKLKYKTSKELMLKKVTDINIEDIQEETKERIDKKKVVAPKLSKEFKGDLEFLND